MKTNNQYWDMSLYELSGLLVDYVTQYRAAWVQKDFTKANTFEKEISLIMDAMETQRRSLLHDSGQRL